MGSLLSVQFVFQLARFGIRLRARPLTRSPCVLSRARIYLRPRQGHKGSRAKGNGPGEAKIQIDALIAGSYDAVARCRAPVPGNVDVAPAVNYTEDSPRITDFSPSVIRGTLVIVMPVILHPFPDVAVHIKEPPGIWLFGPNAVRFFIRILFKPRVLTELSRIVSKGKC